ncbi:hypothetical protein R5R35_004473 [Gryllus longicercus]
MSSDIKRVMSRKSPAGILQIMVKQLMEEEGLWEETLTSDIPTSWEKYGDLLLFNGEKYFRDDRWKHTPNLWQCICKALKAKRIGFKHFISEDSFRSPNVKLVYGVNSWVEFKDNGVIFTWDVQFNMFCAGNAPERHRIATFLCEGETVVDMYAGIGYFTLPYLVKAKAKLVYACEWYPRAVKALKINLSINKVASKCIVYEGDSRLVCPKGIADRVNLGLLPSSESGWQAACEALNPISGGVLHIHGNVTSSIKNKKIINDKFGCKDCVDILCNYDPNEKDLNNNKFCSDVGIQPSFIFHSKTVIPVTNVSIKWKQMEWKLWSLHVCHKLSDIFCSVHEQVWKLQICNLHHVKSYAPHIDHLVLDVKCTPQEYLVQ